jgi:Lipid A 3-O-deacylase (PagL)
VVRGVNTARFRVVGRSTNQGGFPYLTVSADVMKIGATRFELATSWTQTRRSSQAELRPVRAGTIPVFRAAYTMGYMTGTTRLLAALALTGVFAAGARADETEISLVPEAAAATGVRFELIDKPAGGGAAVPREAPPRRPEGSFLKGDRTLALTGAYSFGDNETFYTTAVTGGYFWWDHIAINASLAGHFVDTDEKDTIGVEFNIIPRWHFYVDDRWSVFVEAGAGVSFFDHNLAPPNGTHFNFTPQGGFGATYRLEESTHLLGGVRWFHVSNASYAGSDRHPASNTAMVFLGVEWEF